MPLYIIDKLLSIGQCAIMIGEKYTYFTHMYSTDSIDGIKLKKSFTNIKHIHVHYLLAIH